MNSSNHGQAGGRHTRMRQRDFRCGFQGPAAMSPPLERQPFRREDRL